MKLAAATRAVLAHPDWLDQELAERSLHEFVRQMWRWADPSPFVDSGHIGAICERLEAVSRGEVRRLLINIPPSRHCNSSLVSVFWPAWMWIRSPETSFMAASYAPTLSTRDSVKCRRVIESPVYRKRWGESFGLPLRRSGGSDPRNSLGPSGLAETRNSPARQPASQQESGRLADLRRPGAPPSERRISVTRNTGRTLLGFSAGTAGGSRKAAIGMPRTRPGSGPGSLISVSMTCAGPRPAT